MGVELEGDEVGAGVVDDFGVVAEEAGGIEVEVVGGDLFDVGADGLGPGGDLGEGFGGWVAEEGDEAAHVAVLPGHDGGVVFVAEAGDGVEVIEDGVDVFFVGGDEGGVGEEVLRVGLAMPGEVLADASAGAGGAVAYEGDDELHAVLVGGGDGVVGGGEGGFVELAFGGLDAEGAAYRVAHGLGSDYFGAHLGGGVEGVVDLEVAGEAGAHGVVGAVAFEAQPLDVGAGVAEG